MAQAMLTTSSQSAHVLTNLGALPPQQETVERVVWNNCALKDGGGFREAWEAEWTMTQV